MFKKIIAQILPDSFSAIEKNIVKKIFTTKILANVGWEKYFKEFLTITNLSGFLNKNASQHSKDLINLSFYFLISEEPEQLALLKIIQDNNFHTDAAIEFLSQIHIGSRKHANLKLSEPVKKIIKQILYDFKPKYKSSSIEDLLQQLISPAESAAARKKIYASRIKLNSQEFKKLINQIMSGH